jgi:hypothetical protein
VKLPSAARLELRARSRQIEYEATLADSGWRRSLQIFLMYDLEVSCK